MKKKVAYVVHGLGAEGISSFLCNLIRNVDLNRFDLTVIMAVDRGGALQFREKELLEATHNQIKFVRTCDLYNITYIYKHLKMLEEYFRELGPFDVVHANMDLMNGLILRIAKKCKIPIRISHCHKSSGKRYDSGIKRIAQSFYVKTMQRLIMKNSTKMLGCSDSACDFLYGKGKGEIVLNGIDTEKFHKKQNHKKQLKEKLGVDSERKVIVTVARVNKNKNPIFGVEIAKELKKIRGDFVYLWYGNSETQDLNDNNGLSTRDLCQSKIDAYGLNDYFKFMGVSDEIPSILQASDVFLLLSYFEALPISIIEAECADCDCIVSDSITRMVAVDHKCEFLPTGDAKLWAEQINQLFETGTRNHITDESLYAFDSKTMAEKMMKIYLGK